MVFLETCAKLSPSKELYDPPLFVDYDYKKNFREETDAEIDTSSGSKSSRSSSSSVDSEVERKKAEEAAKIAALKARAEDSPLAKKFKDLSGGSKTISITQAGRLSRMFGFSPSNEDLGSLHQRHGNTLNLEDFTKWLEHLSVTQSNDTASHLEQFFASFDVGHTGTLSKHQVKNILCNFGDKLEAEEVAEMFNKFGLGDPVDYKVLVQRLLETPPDVIMT